MKFSYFILYLAIKHIRVVEIVNYIGTVCMYYVKKNRAITKYARKNTQMKKSPWQPMRLRKKFETLASFLCHNVLTRKWIRFLFESKNRSI